MKELGRGSFGKVYQALVQENNKKDNKQTQQEINQNSQKQLVAIKCFQKIPNDKTNKRHYMLFQQEKEIMQKIDNQNVVKFKDYVEQKNICFLVMEYCNGGNLANYIKSKQEKRLQEDEARILFKQILYGFFSLHEHMVLHRDLKLENILKHDGQLKLADFGLAKQLTSQSPLTDTSCGTQYTMAPEILENRNYGLSCDIYSLGVVFYMMVFGLNKPPFQQQQSKTLIECIKEQKINFKLENDQEISYELQDLLRRMLQYDELKRISLKQIWEHSVITQNFDSQAYIHAIRYVSMEVVNKPSFDCKKIEEINKFYQQCGQQENNPFRQSSIQNNPFNLVQNKEILLNQDTQLKNQKQNDSQIQDFEQQEQYVNNNSYNSSNDASYIEKYSNGQLDFDYFASQTEEEDYNNLLQQEQIKQQIIDRYMYEINKIYLQFNIVNDSQTEANNKFKKQQYKLYVQLQNHTLDIINRQLLEAEPYDSEFDFHSISINKTYAYDKKEKIIEKLFDKLLNSGKQMKKISVVQQQ
ncbi:Protein kinase-like domain [Pseudocohnilembus persalinus]|uniref:Protein kinase-like domain n=1 Tax=Pseudocohnilembus persalinus TaxID=266149 RepID=A0A0V0QUS7_PSEPJ|nr:Protein kinase-like domain [Pseudocohnilembus persalinus]|eukprot:KRX05953.1 Protein kinase-like domain [Pseudocohnilembus persalinus]